MSSELPICWLPLLEWQQRFHYSRQLEYINAVENYWEILFAAGNGTGKSHTLYWSLISFALGVHPHQFAEPPLHVKILMNDFEHGYGKIFSETCLQEQAINRPEHFGAPIFPDAYKDKDCTILKPMLCEDPSMVTGWVSRDDKTMTFYNGSTFFFQTSEQKKKQHSGTNFDVLACDEEPKWEIYDESKRGLRTAKGGGRILHAFTPPFEEETKNKGPSWTKFKLVDPAESGEDQDVKVVRAAMFENPAIDDDFIRKFSKGKTEEQIRIQVYGDYPTWGKMIFPEFEDNIWNPNLKTGHLLSHDFEVPWKDPDFDFEMAVDWHGSKPVAVIWALEVKCGYWNGLEKGDIVVFDEISPQEAQNMTIMQACDAIREHENWYRMKIRRWGDPKMKDKNNALVSGFSPWEEFRHNGVRLGEAWNRDPYVGYSIVRDFLRGRGKGGDDHPRLFIVETCKSLRYNMKNHYNVPRGDGTASPDPKFSDYCVNLKYIMQKKSRKIKKNMDRSGRYAKWPLTSNESSPYQNPYIYIPRT